MNELIFTIQQKGFATISFFKDDRLTFRVMRQLRVYFGELDKDFSHSNIDMKEIGSLIPSDKPFYWGAWFSQEYGIKYFNLFLVGHDNARFNMNVKYPSMDKEQYCGNFKEKLLFTFITGGIAAGTCDATVHIPILKDDMGNLVSHRYRYELLE